MSNKNPATLEFKKTDIAAGNTDRFQIAFVMQKKVCVDILDYRLLTKLQEDVNKKKACPE